MLCSLSYIYNLISYFYVVFYEFLMEVFFLNVDNYVQRKEVQIFYFIYYIG